MLMSSQGKQSAVEKIIKSDMQSPGGFLSSTNDRWCMGSWRAMQSTLVFKKNEHVRWACLYPAITGLAVEERPFSFGTKKTLRIEHSHQQKKEIVWLVVDALARWERWIRQRAFPRSLTENDLLSLAKGLDATAEQLVWLFWKRRHLSLDELESLGFAQDASEVLKTMKEMINPLAEEKLGVPLCIFLEAKVDAVTGETISNSWWLNDLLTADDERGHETGA